MTKIYIPEQQRKSPARIYILEEGIQHNKNVVRCKTPKEADYIFVEKACQHFVQENPQYFDKTVMVDFRDHPFDLLPDYEKYFLYCKRSIVDPKDMSIIQYDRDIVPILYPIKNHDLQNILRSKKDKEIDIAVFFNNEYKYRGSVARYVKENFSNYNIQVGTVGAIGNTGRRSKQELYYDVMANSKIVVNCNPDEWFGDWRLFEAISSGALVIADKMPMPVKNPFTPGENLVYYDRNNLDSLGHMIQYYLDNPNERNQIAINSLEFCYQHHTAMHRVDEIINECKLKENE